MSYLRRVLCKTRLIFPRTNGPNDTLNYCQVSRETNSFDFVLGNGRTPRKPKVIIIRFNFSSFLLAESLLCHLQITAYKQCNCLLRRNVVQLCLAANNILLLLLQRSLLRKNGRSFCSMKIFITKQTSRSNGKTIIELSYRKIS